MPEQGRVGEALTKNPICAVVKYAALLRCLLKARRLPFKGKSYLIRGLCNTNLRH